MAMTKYPTWAALLSELAQFITAHRIMFSCVIGLLSMIPYARSVGKK